MLARRAYSVGELRQALRRKAFDATAVEDALTRLKKLGYLDDRKFAQEYASSLVRNRGFGRYRVQRELKARRVAERYIKPALEQAFGETDEPAVLERVLERKMRALRLPLTRSRLYSLCQSLRRQGFRSEDIVRAVRTRPELAPVAEETDLDTLED
jgi:regulatory protein